MVQSLDVISVNIWQIIISLANLLILFLLVKKFLFKPVNNILQKRENEIENQYNEAKKAEQEANANKEKWENAISGAKQEADNIISDATSSAKFQSEKIVEDAKMRADGIIRQAEIEADLEHKKAQERIKQDIVEVSSAIAEKMLEREIDTNDHRNLIDSFIEKIGDSDESDK
ncbi:MAG: F0F1 ATP synthase subunit B [Ruminococcaceae bacterium]|nr:F0F1 ATP synthase subunit B [Oscillospiraceae bacterium]